MQEGVCVLIQKGSLKQASPELAARKVKERGGGGGGEHFKQRKGHIWRPEAVRPRLALGQMQIHLSMPTPEFLGGARRLVFFEVLWKVLLCSHLGA